MYRCSNLSAVLLACRLALVLGDVEATAAKTSCLLQASEIRLEANHSEATTSPARGTWDDWVQLSDQRIKWTIAVVFVLTGSWTLCKEALAASSEENGSKKRDALWDMSRSALMILVINLHFQGNETITFGIKLEDDWPCAFYMPAYFIISGMFSKRRGDNYWSGILVNNVFNACLFAPIYAPWNSPICVFNWIYPGWISQSVGNLWFLWALAAYRALLQPLLAACHGRLGRCGGAGAGILVAAVFHYVITAIPVEIEGQRRGFNILNLTIWDQHRIGFHAIFFALGFAMDVDTVRQILQNKNTLAFSMLHMLFLVWACYGTYIQSQYLKGLLTEEDLPDHFLPLDRPRDWTLTVAHRTLASLSFIALLVPLADAQSSCMSFLRHMFALSGKRTLYAYCLQFVFMERLNMAGLQLKIDGRTLQYLPKPYNMCIHQCMQVLFMFSLCSPFAERAFHFMVSPQWVLDLTDPTRSFIRPKSSALAAEISGQNRS